VSEIIGISDHLGGFLLRRGCPGEKAWFSPRSTPTVGSLTPPPGLTTSPQASLPACPAVGLSTKKILSDGCGGIEPPRRSAILPHLKSGACCALWSTNTRLFSIRYGVTIAYTPVSAAARLRSRTGRLFRVRRIGMLVLKSRSSGRTARSRDSALLTISLIAHFISWRARKAPRQ